MSPLLLNLYLGLVLFSLPSFVGKVFSFIDDILFRVRGIKAVQAI